MDGQANVVRQISEAGNLWIAIRPASTTLEPQDWSKVSWLLKASHQWVQCIQQHLTQTAPKPYWCACSQKVCRVVFLVRSNYQNIKTSKLLNIKTIELFNLKTIKLLSIKTVKLSSVKTIKVSKLSKYKNYQTIFYIYIKNYRTSQLSKYI